MPTDVLDRPKADAADETIPEGATVMTGREEARKEESGISKKLETNKAVLKERMGLGLSFDLLTRDMTIGTKKISLLYINGFAQGAVLTEVLKRLTYLEREQLVPDVLAHLFERYVPHIQVETSDNMEDCISKVLAGTSALFVDGEKKAILIDAKNFPTRSVEEPQLERVIRGSRDGFVETLMTNMALLRRRIRDPRLKLEITKVGKRTQTDICIAYINDIADPKLVQALKKKMDQINLDGLPLADKQLEEAVIAKSWNPYPLVRYSERPDVVATHLLEGHVALFVDTSPSVMILPATFFHLVQHAEEYRETPFVGTYLRWVRFLGIWASVFLLPFWFLLATHPEFRPAWLHFLGPGKTAHLPLVAQFFIVELGTDLMRMAAVHTPTPLATALGLVAAVLLGNVAVDTGLFVNEVILYMAFAAIGMFATPSYEMSMANRIVRLGLLVATWLFGASGFVAGTTFVVLALVLTRSFNTPYMWPFIPFNAKAFLQLLIRRPVLRMNVRPSITKPQDRSRQPN